MAEAVRVRATEGAVPLTKEERMDAAWRLVLTPTEPGSNAQYAYSKSTVRRKTAVSEGAISEMRRRLDAMRQAGQTPSGSWRRDKRDPAGWQRAELTSAERAAMVAAVGEAVKGALAAFRRKDDEAVMEGIAEGMGEKLTRAFLDYMSEGAMGEAYDERWSGVDPTKPEPDF